MEPSGCLLETVSTGQLEVAVPGAAGLAAEGDLVWTKLEEKLEALAAAACARQCRRSSLGRESKEVLGEVAHRFVRRVVETFQQATEELACPDEQAAARAAISYLFALDRSAGPGATARKRR